MNVQKVDTTVGNLVDMIQRGEPRLTYVFGLSRAEAEGEWDEERAPRSGRSMRSRRMAGTNGR